MLMMTTLTNPKIWVLGSGVGYCLLALGIAAIAYKGAMESNLRRLERCVELAFTLPTLAQYTYLSHIRRKCSSLIP